MAKITKSSVNDSNKKKVMSKMLSITALKQEQGSVNVHVSTCLKYFINCWLAYGQKVALCTFKIKWVNLKYKVLSDKTT